MLSDAFAAAANENSHATLVVLGVASGVLLLEMGDRTGALDALERAYADFDWGLVPAMHYKMLAALHGEPRFERLVDALGPRRRVQRLVDLLRGR